MEKVPVGPDSDSYYSNDSIFTNDSKLLFLGIFLLGLTSDSYYSNYSKLLFLGILLLGYCR